MQDTLYEEQGNKLHIELSQETLMQIFHDCIDEIMEVQAKKLVDTAIINAVTILAKTMGNYNEEKIISEKKGKIELEFCINTTSTRSFLHSSDSFKTKVRKSPIVATYSRDPKHLDIFYFETCKIEKVDNMKIAIIAIIALLEGVFGQDATLTVNTEWPQNEDSNAGALVNFAYSDVGEGSCTAELPEAVNLFHVTNGHIVPEDSSPIEGSYKIAAPANWEFINGTITVLIISTGTKFSILPISFLSICLLLPQNDLRKEASSNVFKRSGFHEGDVLTITLPAAVARFNITGGDSELVVDGKDTTYTVSGFRNEQGNGDHNEVHFSIEYSREAGTWFSAGEITVSVTENEASEDSPET
uniref:uncharacterized protein LOC120330150 n=1 Tax=Styela clava TaxID=7725 RepID=UPI0019396DEB|nr:uncharacterized protein LOC120330150 [Styela clava]